MIDTVKVPEEMEAIFAEAEKIVSSYFGQKQFHPHHGSIEIFGDRYILLRGASISVEFFQLCRSLFGTEHEIEADLFASNFLYELAHAIGKSDAKRFHQKMNLTDPISKLSAGPVHFSHTGWAYVDIDKESSPTSDDNFFLAYTHPYSFENDAWTHSSLTAHSPVCVMNAGYSSGWCEESFDMPLEARELTCCATGNDKCRFVMAPPDRIEQRITMYLASHPEVEAKNVPSRKLDIDELNKSQLGQKPGFRDLMSEHLFTYARNLETTKKILNRKVEELLESEEKFRSVFEQAAMGIARISTDGAWLEVNNKLCDIIGYTKDELKYLNVQDITHPDDLETDHQFVEKMLAGTIDTYSLEKRYIQKSGELVWVNLTVSLTKKEDGEPKYFVSIVEDISWRKEYEQELNFRLGHDGLTGLSSRTATIDTLDKELKRSLRYKRPLSILMIDIDHFKKVNDEFGHQSGDQVLQEVSKVFSSTVRACDMVGRYGGEEFLVVLPELSREDAAQLAQRILRNVAQRKITLDKKVISVRVSIGVACLSDKLQTTGKLIGAADSALYEAKDSGRNQVKLDAG